MIGRDVPAAPGRLKHRRLLEVKDWLSVFCDLRHPRNNRILIDLEHGAKQRGNGAATPRCGPRGVAHSIRPQLPVIPPEQPQNVVLFAHDITPLRRPTNNSSSMKT